MSGRKGNLISLKNPDINLKGQNSCDNRSFVCSTCVRMVTLNRRGAECYDARSTITSNNVNDFSTCRGNKKREQQLEMRGCTMQLCTKGMTVFTHRVVKVFTYFWNNPRIESVLIIQLIVLFDD